jgi:methylmalonyl-CoA/ethylmalonyl-CoA epimerase
VATFFQSGRILGIAAKRWEISNFDARHPQPKLMRRITRSDAPLRVRQTAGRERTCRQNEHLSQASHIAEANTSSWRNIGALPHRLCAWELRFPMPFFYIASIFASALSMQTITTSHAHGRNRVVTMRIRLICYAENRFMAGQAHTPAVPRTEPAERVPLKHHHGGISVPDLEATLAWYRDVLGFEEEKRFDIPPIPAKVALIRRGELRMEIFEVPGASPLPDERRHPDRDAHTHGNKHIAFAVENVDEMAEELRARGADIVFVMRASFGANIFIRDNAGNLLEFVEAPEMWR